VTILHLKCDSVRLPYGKKADGEPLDKVKAYIGPHQVANTLLVLTGKRAVSSRLRLKESGLITDNQLYNSIVGGIFPFQISLRYCTIDILTEFKSSGRETGAAKTGEFNEQWFENCYRKQRSGYVPGLVSQFKQWMRDTFSNVGLDSFANLLTELERRIVDSAAKNNTTCVVAAKHIIPERFHSFNVFFGSEFYYASLSKYATKPYFVRTDGSIQGVSAAGSVVLIGGPVYMLNCGFDLLIDIEHRTFLKVLGDINTGRGAASIGDGGVCVLDREAHNV
jgi:hypothetical protein